MKSIVEKPVNVSFEALSLYASAEDVLFYDIETTGLSPYDSEIYLIGSVALEDGVWTMRQWFSESFSEEALILQAFLSYAENYHTLVSYNGDAFDRKFLSKSAEQYGYSFDFSAEKSIDLYRYVKKLKKLLGLDSMRQKDLEAFLSIGRADEMSGGELIKVYRSYQQTKSEEALHLLLLHNHDDLCGLTRLPDVLAYDAFFKEDGVGSVAGKVDEENQSLVIFATAAAAFPVAVEKPLPFGGTIRLQGTAASLTVPLEKKILRRYFPEYRDYFYLPAEGYAIHRTVGEFVDPAFRVKATKETAFILREDRFVRSYGALSLTEYVPEYRSKEVYYRAAEIEPVTYLKSVLSALL